MKTETKSASTLVAFLYWVTANLIGVWILVGIYFQFYGDYKLFPPELFLIIILLAFIFTYIGIKTKILD